MIHPEKASKSISRFCAIAGVWLAFACATSRGAVIITAPDITLPYSASAQSGSFEVYVQDTDAPGTSPEIGVSNVQLELPNTPEVEFTGAGATTSMAHPYLFGALNPGTSVTSDLVVGTNFPGTPPTLADGDGLLLVDYTVAAGATGTFALTFDDYNAQSDVTGTALFDQNSHLIATSDQNGSITISPAPVPEPASIALMLIAGALGGLWLLARRNHRRPLPVAARS